MASWSRLRRGGEDEGEDLQAEGAEDGPFHEGVCGAAVRGPKMLWVSGAAAPGVHAPDQW